MWNCYLLNCQYDLYLLNLKLDILFIPDNTTVKPWYKSYKIIYLNFIPTYPIFSKYPWAVAPATWHKLIIRGGWLHGSCISPLKCYMSFVYFRGRNFILRTCVGSIEAQPHVCGVAALVPQPTSWIKGWKHFVMS